MSVTTVGTGYSAALRWLADAVEDGLPMPSGIASYEVAWFFFSGMEGKGTAAEQLREVRALLPHAVWEKSYSDNYYTQTTELFGIEFKLMTGRGAVCTKVVKGTTVELVPDPDYVAPEVPMVEKEVEVVEWVCGEDA